MYARKNSKSSKDICDGDTHDETVNVRGLENIIGKEWIINISQGWMCLKYKRDCTEQDLRLMKGYNRKR